MTEDLHLADRVEIVSDKFATIGVPRGAIGMIISVWADGSKEVEFSDAKTGHVVATVRATEDELRAYAGAGKLPRKHGIIFGRGDGLDDDVEMPPMPTQQRDRLPFQNGPAQIAFNQAPDEDVHLTGDIPWELRD